MNCSVMMPVILYCNTDVLYVILKFIFLQNRLKLSFTYCVT